MSQAIFNLHNHTPFSDGAYDFDELADEHCRVLGDGIGGVGFSDHLFCTPSSREIRSEKEFERLFARETRKYVDAVHAARKRWAGRLEILCGAEINWTLNRTMLDHIRPLLDGVDYVLFEFVDWAGLTTLANQARRFPCPIGLAHADVAEQFPNTSMDQVVRTLANARIFWEFNHKHTPPDERQPWFKILPPHKVRVCLGTDTHDDLECIRELPAMHSFLLRQGLADKLFVPPRRAVEAPQPALPGAMDAVVVGAP